MSYRIKTLKEIQAMMLKRLVKAHKKKCNGNCNIAVSILFPIYQELMGDYSGKDREVFF